MAVRSQSLQRALRCFCLGGFNLLGSEGAELPFAFEEHSAPGRTLPVRVPAARAQLRRGARGTPGARATTRGSRSRSCAREPAAAIFARAHAGVKPTEEEALLRTVLLPLLVKTAEACGGFDWDDNAFDHAYADFERSLFGERRAYAARHAGDRDLGSSPARSRPRHSTAPGGDRRAASPLARGARAAPSGLRPRARPSLRARAGAGASPRAVEPPGRAGGDRRRRHRAQACDGGPGRGRPRPASSGSTGGRSASGPSLPIAATQPAGEPTRLDAFRARLASDLRRAARGRRRRSRARRGARPLGAVSLPGRAVPIRAAA